VPLADPSHSWGVQGRRYVGGGPPHIPVPLRGYGGDFVIQVQGSKEKAEQIRGEVHTFLPLSQGSAPNPGKILIKDGEARKERIRGRGPQARTRSGIIGEGQRGKQVKELAEQGFCKFVNFPRKKTICIPTRKTA
jgi:hypothetical protein